MSNKVSVQLKLDKAKISKVNVDSTRSLIRMGYDIANQARRNAPYLTGALRNTIRVQEVSQSVVEVIAGGSYGGKSVRYAWKREQGPNKNSSTEHYMENAQKQIMSGDYLKKYFGDIL